MPAGQDRRAVVLSLTERGRSIAMTAERRRLDSLRRLLEASLSPEQRVQLTGLVEVTLRAVTGGEPALRRICRLCSFDACSECPVASEARA